MRRSLVAGLLFALASSACQTHDAERVEPNALTVANTPFEVYQKPLVMLVVDRSGSMHDSATTPGVTCLTEGDVYDPAGNCKLNDLKTSFAGATGFLNGLGDLAILGLSSFPTGGLCDAGGIDVAPSLTDSRESQVRTAINALTPLGATPTTKTLKRIVSDVPLLRTAEQNRRRIMLLLTDGLPNCSETDMTAKCDACVSQLTCSAPDGCFPFEDSGWRQVFGVRRPGALSSVAPS